MTPHDHPICRCLASRGAHIRAAHVQHSPACRMSVQHAHLNVVLATMLRTTNLFAMPACRLMRAIMWICTKL